VQAKLQQGKQEEASPLMEVAEPVNKEI